MQETQYYDKGRQRRLMELFSGLTDKGVQEKMDARFEVLKGKGHTLVRRVKIGRNEMCPCGSGIKFKKCHLGKEGEIGRLADASQ